MLTVLTTLPHEIYLLLAKFLPPHDVQRLAQTCVCLRSVFRQLSWRVCKVIPDSSSRAKIFRRSYRKIHQWPTFQGMAVRGVPLVVLRKPHGYSWFMPKLVEHLYLEKDFDGFPLDKYPALKSLHVAVTLQRKGHPNNVKDKFDDPWVHEKQALQFLERTTHDQRLAHISRISVFGFDLDAYLRMPIPGLETTARVTKLQAVHSCSLILMPPHSTPFVLKHVTLLVLFNSEVWSRLTWVTQLIASLSQWTSLVLLKLAPGKLFMSQDGMYSEEWVSILENIPPGIRSVLLYLVLEHVPKPVRHEALPKPSVRIAFPTVTELILVTNSQVDWLAEYIEFPSLSLLRLRGKSRLSTQAQLLTTCASCSVSLTWLEVHFDSICYEGTIFGLRQLVQLKRLRIAYRDNAWDPPPYESKSVAERKATISTFVKALLEGTDPSKNTHNDNNLKALLEVAMRDPCEAWAHHRPPPTRAKEFFQSNYEALRVFLALEVVYDTVLNYLPTLEHLALHYCSAYMISPALARLLRGTLDMSKPRPVFALQQIKLVALRCSTAEEAKFACLPEYPVVQHTVFSRGTSMLYDIRKARSVAQYHRLPKRRARSISYSNRKVTTLDFSMSQEADLMSDEFEGWEY